MNKVRHGQTNQNIFLKQYYKKWNNFEDSIKGMNAFHFYLHTEIAVRYVT